MVVIRRMNSVASAGLVSRRFEFDRYLPACSQAQSNLRVRAMRLYRPRFVPSPRRATGDLVAASTTGSTGGGGGAGGGKVARGSVGMGGNGGGPFAGMGSGGGPG